MSEFPHDPPQGVSNVWADLRTRSLSAIIIATIALLAVLLGGFWFSALVIAAALLMLREWDALTDNLTPRWKQIGLAYVILPCSCAIALREFFYFGETASIWYVLSVILLVAICDISAYLVGRTVGGPKLAPEISPGKTWAGAIGALAATMFASLLMSSFLPYPHNWKAGLLVGFVVAMAAMAGDLFESWLKRQAGVKDSGNLLPGHGGILDRVDGLAFALPAYTLLLLAALAFA